MIELRDVSVFHNNAPVLRNISAKINPGDRVGILGAAGSGKTTLLRIISGTQRPERGSITRNAQVSWPLGSAAAFHPNLSAAENVAHLARINGLDTDFCVAFCSKFTGLISPAPLRNYTPAMRARLAFGFSFATPFDIYLADETVGTGDDMYRARCAAMLKTRLTNAGLILTSRRARTLSQYCDRFFALTSGALIPCPNVEIAESIIELENDNLKEYACA